MTCDEVLKKLSWHIDGELPGEEVQAVGAHLLECAACRAEKEALLGADAAIRAALVGSKPARGFAGRVVAAASAAPAKPAAVRPWPAWLKRVARVAALVLIALGLSTLYVNTLTASPLAVDVSGGDSFHADSMAALRVLVSNGATRLPVAGASVRVALAGAEIGRFTTGAAGTVDGSFRVPDLADGRYPLRLEVESPIGSDALERAVTVRREYRLLLTTDKPMYQPGQEIQLRALALNAFTLKPRAGDAEFEVVDSKGNRIFTKKTKLSDFGIGSASMPLADEVNLGTYRVAVTASGLRQERTIEVAKYVLPKFKLELELDRTSYRPLETVKGTVRASYFFGKPVRGRAKATIGREVVTGDLREDGSWSFEAPAGAEGAGKVEVTVTDTADHAETKASAIVVAKEPLKVLLVPEGGQIVYGIENAFYVLVSYPDGRPAKAEVRLRVNGALHDVATDDLGVGRIAAREPYAISLEQARDKAGNETKAMEARTPIGGDDFLVRLDKPAYKGGETMTVRVLGAPGPVYVDFIKGGQLLLAKAVEKGELAFDIPPDLFGTLQVIAYRRHSARPQVRLAYVNLPDGLRIRPRAAKETFRPGEEMPVEFEVTDAQGRPIQAALGIAVVDEALYGLVESKIASEKAWLSLAPELVDTRGFLRADAAEIFGAANRNAQGFVCGNAKAARPPALVQGSYQRRVEELALFVATFNDWIGTGTKVAAIVLLSLLALIVLGVPLVRFVGALFTARVPGYAIVIALAVAALGVLVYGQVDRIDRGAFFLLLAACAFIGLEFSAAVWWFRRGRRAETVLCVLLTLGTVIWGGTLATEPDAEPLMSWERFSVVMQSKFAGRQKLPPTYDQYEAYVQAYRETASGQTLRAVPSAETHPTPVPLSVPPPVEPAKPPLQHSSGERIKTYGIDMLSTTGYADGDAGPKPARIREYFPETLFWMPELITDERGHATLTLPPADSITSWRMLASGIARTGALGFETANLKVFQDFFADIDFPVALTKGDRVHVPVAVYNYLKEPQTVAVRVQREAWFELLDDETKSIALKAGEVSVVYFGLKVKEHGRKSLTVFADGKVSDALRRSVELMEKGREVPITSSERVRGRHAFKVEIPARAIEGATVLFARIAPAAGDLLGGLQGMIRMPYG
jgi:anti-sigma factor RsiW